jgi:hypothetical protein
MSVNYSPGQTDNESRVKFMIFLNAQLGLFINHTVLEGKIYTLIMALV